ncbi:MAG: PDZ domain-containing protein [Acinetobacter parvus]
MNTRIGKIMPNTPAAFDLQVGDKILAVDGQTTPTWEKLNYTCINRVGETGQVSIIVDQAGTEKQFNLLIKDFLKDQSQ